MSKEIEKHVCREVSQDEWRAMTPAERATVCIVTMPDGFRIAVNQGLLAGFDAQIGTVAAL